jgi:hypothetical protein
MDTFIDKTFEMPVYQIYGWVFSGMEFSENINGRILSGPSIALTFSSNICIIHGRLLPSRACFRLYRCNESSAKFSMVKNKLKNLLKNLFVIKKIYNFVNLK